MTPRILKTSLLSQVIVAALLAGTASAQTSSAPNEGLNIGSSAGNYDMSWWGRAGRTYFIQQTNDLLTPWQYLPLIESGADAPLAWGFTSTAPATFLRLRYSDIPTADPFAADFDGDKVGNFAELTNGTDPLRSLDSDNDGLPDDWELSIFGNLTNSGTADADGDSLTNLAEFQQGTNPTLIDTDADGIADDQDTAPTDADRDGDGFKDGEDRWPDDPRRGDYIPAKFFAVTDLSAYLTEQERAGFMVTQVAINDEHEAAFVGIFQHPTELDSSQLPVKYIRAYRWKDGAIVGRSEHLASWWSYVGDTVKHPGPAPLPMPNGPSAYFVEFSFTPRDIASTGTVVGSGWNDCMPTSRVTARSEIPLGFTMETPLSSTVSVNLTWTPASDSADPYESFSKPRAPYESDYEDDFSIPGGFFEVAENRGELTIFGGTHLKAGSLDSVRDVPIQTEGQPPISDKPDHFTLPTLNGVNLGSFADIGLTRPAASGESISIGTYPNIPLEGSGNPKGNLAPDGSMIFKKAVDRYASGGVTYETRYLYKNGTSYVEYSAPEGIVRMNVLRNANGALTGLHQAIGYTYNPSTGDNDAFFAWENGTRGNWSQMPFQQLLKWTNKPQDIKDDYERYFARTPKNGEPAQPQIKNMVPMLISNVDPTTAGQIVNGVTFGDGLPVWIQFRCLVPDESQSSNGEGWVEADLVFQYHKNLGYRVSERKTSNPDEPIEQPLALTIHGAMVAPILVGGGAGYSYEVSIETENAYRGIDPPLKGDKPNDGDGEPDEKTPIWRAGVGYRGQSANAFFPEDALSALLAPSGAKTPDELSKRQPGLDPLYFQTAVTNNGLRFKVVDETPSGNYVNVDFAPTSSFTNGQRFTIEGQSGPQPEGVDERGTKFMSLYATDNLGNPRAKAAIKYELDVMPIRYVKIGLWYLDDGNDITPDIPGDYGAQGVDAAWLNASRVMGMLNKAFAQACIQFVPLLPEGNAPKFRRLDVPGFGEQHPVDPTWRVLNLNNLDQMQPLHRPALGHPTLDANAIHLIFVRRVNGPKQPFGAVYPQFDGDIIVGGKRDRAFVQTYDFEKFVGTHPEYAVNKRNGKELVLEEMYRVAVHEIGHVLYLSTRNPNQGSHDNGPAPFFSYNRDGTPVPLTLVPCPLEEPDDLQTVLYPWSTPFIRKTNKIGLVDKQRISLPVMGAITGGVGYDELLQNLGAEIYMSKRSFWIRHEDWREANDKAVEWEVKP